MQSLKCLLREVADLQHSPADSLVGRVMARVVEGIEIKSGLGMIAIGVVLMMGCMGVRVPSAFSLDFCIARFASRTLISFHAQQGSLPILGAVR